MSQQTDAGGDVGLAVETRAGPGRTVVTVVGEVDLATVGELERAVSDALAEGAALVALDLRAVGFIDSTGLQALVRLDELARAGGRTLAIDESPAVRRLLDLTGLGARFETAVAPARER